MKAWTDGKLVDEREATVSVLDYGLVYGYGLFESMLAKNGVVFRLDRHLARLREGAAEIGIPLNSSDGEISAMIQETLTANKLTGAYVRLTVTRGAGEPRLKFSGETKPTIVVIARPLPADIKEKQSQGVGLAVSKKHCRFSRDIRSRIKSTNYLLNALAKTEAHELGVDDVILLNEKGLVAECSTANIFIIRDGVLVTPPLECGILAGITRDAVIEVASELGIIVEERKVTVEELSEADEVFKTSSILGVVPAVEVDGRRVGDGRAGETTKKIQGAYNMLVETECR